MPFLLLLGILFDPVQDISPSPTVPSRRVTASPHFRLEHSLKHRAFVHGTIVSGV
jgi:hypothetical protein